MYFNLKSYEICWVGPVMVTWVCHINTGNQYFFYTNEPTGIYGQMENC